LGSGDIVSARRRYIQGGSIRAGRAPAQRDALSAASLDRASALPGSIASASR
jgi:hypothetical protein